LAQRPYVGRCRVAVFTDAGNMTREAHNALLKTLEDPPRDAALILLAPRTEALPATVVSRCRHIPVGGLTWREVSRTLVDDGLDQSRALFAALWAGEDLAQARALAGRDDLEQIRSQAVDFVAGAVGPQPEPPLELIEKYQSRLSNTEEAGLWLAALVVALRGAIAAGRGGEDFVAGAFLASERRVLGTLDPGAAAQMTGQISQAAGAIARHAQARLSLEAALLADRGLAAPGPWPH
jgi:DNA polymerase-3 subunit delta'